MVPGTLELDGFHPWLSGLEESAVRIEREVAIMIRDAVDPEPGDVCWFELSPKLKAEAKLRDSQEQAR